MVPPQGPRPPGCDGAVRAAVLPRPALVCYVEARSGHQRTRNPDTGAGNPPAAYGGLNARREETRRLLGATKTLPTPDTLPLIVTSLQEMVSLSGMQSSHFVPAAETVVEKNRIRLDGTLSGPPDNFRRLVLLLSEQPWLSGMEFLNVTPSGALPAYSLGIWATFTQQANTPRH